MKEKTCRWDKDDNGTWHSNCTCVNVPEISDEGDILRDLLIRQSRRIDKMENALKAFADPDNWFGCYSYVLNFTPHPGWRGPMEDNPEKFAQEALDYDGVLKNEETNNQAENS